MKTIFIIVLILAIYKVYAFKWTPVQTFFNNIYLGNQISRSRFSLLPYSNSKNANDLYALNYIALFGYDTSIPQENQYFFTFLSVGDIYDLQENHNYNIFGIFSSIGNSYTPYISSLIYPPDATGIVAVLVKPMEYHLIGGKNKSQYINNITQVNIFLDIDKSNLTITKNTKSYYGFQRIGHTVVYNSNGLFFIYGGYNESGIYSGLYQYLPTIPDITLIDSPNPPPNRAWHSCLMTKAGEMWLFGGYNGTDYYNDIWKFNGTWTQYFPKGDIPTSRAGHVMLFPKLNTTTNDETGFYIHGGETTGNVKLNDIWQYSIISNTWTLVDNSSTSPKLAYHSGQTEYSKLTSTTTMFYMGGINDTGGVSTKIIAFDICHSLDQYHCWNGNCEDNPYDCSFIRPCMGKRCGDGTCKQENDTTCIAGLVCLPPLQLCGDGKCFTECTVTYGCLPDSKPFQCPDGTCVANSTQCNALHCNNNETSCYNGCAINCTVPIFIYPISEAYFTTIKLYKNSSTLYIISDSNKIQGIITLDGSDLLQPLSISNSLSSVTPLELFSIGPYPTWTDEFKSFYIASVVAKLQISNVKELIENGGYITAYIEFIQNNFKTSEYCIAEAVPWYWDPFDAMDNSTLRNVSYISSYRNLVQPYLNSPNNNISIPGIDKLSHPPLRWRCLNDLNNRWPQYDNDPTKRNWYGIYIVDSINTTIAMIRTRDPSPGGSISPSSPSGGGVPLMSSLLFNLFFLMILLPLLLV